MPLHETLNSTVPLSYLERETLSETLAETSRDLFKTTTGSHHINYDSTNYHPPRTKQSELSHLKQSMHFIPYESEPHYLNEVDMSPMHLTERKQPLPSPYKNYMYCTTSGIAHSEYSAQQLPKYSQPEHKKSPFNPKMSFIGNYQQEEEQKYSTGTYRFDNPTATSAFVHPSKKYVSEAKDKYQKQSTDPIVADTWNKNVDTMRDRYIHMDHLTKKPLVTQPVELKSTYNHQHGPDNTYLRTDKIDEKETQEMLHYTFRDVQQRGKNKGPNVNYDPKSLASVKLEPLTKDVYVQQFASLNHKGMSSTTGETHYHPDDTLMMATNTTRPTYQFSGLDFKPEPHRGKLSTTMNDSYKPVSPDQLNNTGRDYTRTELRKPQILKRNKLEPGVTMMPKYNGAGIGQQQIVDSAHPTILHSMTKTAEYRTAQHGRRMKEDGREEYTNLLMSHSKPPLQRNGDKLPDPAAHFFKTTNESKNHEMLQLSGYHAFD
jgi:hypothetical protein